MKKNKLIQYTINAALFAFGVYMAICAFHDAKRKHDNRYKSCIDTSKMYDNMDECGCFNKYPLADRVARFQK